MENKLYSRPWINPIGNQTNLIKIMMKQEKFVISDTVAPEKNLKFSDLILQASSCLDMFLQNRIEEGFKLCKEKASYSIYHRYGVGMMLAINAFTSIEPQVIQYTIEEMEKIVDFLEKHKPRIGLFSSTNFEMISDEQAHAALCFTELNTLLAMLKALSDRSFKGFLSAAFRFKSSYTCFRECVSLYHKKPFDDDLSSIEFHNGVRMIHGLFGMFFSFLPVKFTSLLEYLGWFNDRYQGLKILRKCLVHKETLRFTTITLALSAYHGFLEYIFGLGEADIDLMDQVYAHWNSKYPNSFYVSLMAGIREMNHSRFEAACDHLHHCLSLPTLSPHLYKIAYFFMVLGRMQLCDWAQAAEVMKLLKGDKVSPATSTYFYAVLLLMDYDLNEKLEHQTEIVELIRSVPSLKKTLGGRKPFHEKLVYERTIKFNGDFSQFFLPTFEISYIWNLFRMSRFSEALLRKYTQIVEGKLRQMRPDEDGYVACIFYRAHFAEVRGEYSQAIEDFLLLLRSEEKISHSARHFVPQACFELGNLYRKIDRYHDAREFLVKAKSYRNYLTESMVSYRVQLAFERLKKMEKLGRKLSSPFDQ